MNVRLALVLVVVATTVAVLALPLLAAPNDCEEDRGGDCCDLDCALCVCCSHTPQKVLSELGGGADREIAGWLGPEESARPRGPLPREILHVPRSAPAS